MLGCSAISPELIAVLRVVQFGTRPSCCITIRSTTALSDAGLRTRTDSCTVGDEVLLQAFLLRYLTVLHRFVRLLGLYTCTDGCIAPDHVRLKDCLPTHHGGLHHLPRQPDAQMPAMYVILSGTRAFCCIISRSTHALPDCLAYLHMLMAVV